MNEGWRFLNSTGERALRRLQRGLARSGFRLVLMTAGFTLLAGEANAQMPVIDTTAITNQIRQLTQMVQQLTTLEAQLAQAQQLYSSLNKLTNMGDVATLLNNPAIRQALPPDFANLEKLFTGDGSGVVGQAATKFLEANRTYTTPGNDFYATELKRQQQQNAGNVGLAQQMYETATQRIQGIDQLRKQISTTSDAKGIMDLQARLQAEAAFLQTDVLRMQGLQMIQKAQLDVQEQRDRENWRRRLDAMKGTSQ